MNELPAGGTLFLSAGEPIAKNLVVVSALVIRLCTCSCELMTVSPLQRAADDQHLVSRGETS